MTSTSQQTMNMGGTGRGRTAPLVGQTRQALPRLEPRMLLRREPPQGLRQGPQGQQRQRQGHTQHQGNSRQRRCSMQEQQHPVEVFGRMQPPAVAPLLVRVLSDDIVGETGGGGRVRARMRACMRACMCFAAVRPCQQQHTRPAFTRPPFTGLAYVHAHNEVARLAAEALEPQT